MNTVIIADRTPGPYSFRLNPAYMNADIYGAGRKPRTHVQHVAQVWSGDDQSMAVVQANADFLCQSSNAHEALLGVVESLIRDIELTAKRRREDPASHFLYARAKMALELARGNHGN